MYRLLLLACLASITSGCLLSVATLVPLTPDATKPGVPGATQPQAQNQPSGPNLALLQSLPGDWLFVNNAGAVVMQFRQDGSVTSHANDGSSDTDTIVQGRFTLMGDALTISFPNINPIAGKLSFSADKRTLFLGNAQMTRVEGGISP